MEDYSIKSKDKDIVLNLNIDLQSDFLILADSHFLYQIFDNLISNAIKYSPFGKSIDIEIYKLEHRITIVIKDNGPGISDEEQQLLFIKFSKLTPKPTGNEHSTGLGLSIVKRLVEMMNGRVWCKSELGQGTSFFVSFLRA